MKTYIVIYGPPRSGKSLNLEALKRHYECDHVCDDYYELQRGLPEGAKRVLVLCNGELCALPGRRPAWLKCLDGAQRVSIQDAKIALGDQWVVYRCDKEARRVGIAPFETAENWRALGYEPRVSAKLPDKWRPSIHMPRSASRLSLEIISIGVERLQDISEEDALAEGIHRFEVNGCEYFHACPTAPTEQHFNSAVMAYRDLWESINGAGSWAENPWVWVVKFKRVEVGGENA